MVEIVMFIQHFSALLVFSLFKQITVTNKVYVCASPYVYPFAIFLVDRWNVSRATAGSGYVEFPPPFLPTVSVGLLYL